MEGQERQVKILDFGLARTAAEGHQLTQSGAILGTPAYMAPEQAEDQPVDARSDLFSLGCVLYRMCTGELPFKGNSTMAILRSLAVATPPSPHSLHPEIPVELSDLVLRLLAKDPRDRPQSAQEVASALPALTQEKTAEITRPKQTPPPTPGPVIKPTGGLARRLAVAATVAVVLLGLALGVVYWPKPGGGPSEPTPGPSENKSAEGPAPAPVALAEWQPGPAEGVLPGLVARPARLDGLRRWQIETVALRGISRCLAWSSDGKFLAVGLGSGPIRIYDGTTFRLTRMLVGHTRPVSSLSWSRSGRLASASPDRTIRLWECDGTPGPVLRDEEEVYAVAWRPDDTLLASGNKKGLVRLWRPDGSPERVLAGHKWEVWCLNWSPDGKHLASGGQDKTVRLWDMPANRVWCSRDTRPLSRASPGARMAGAWPRWEESETPRSGSGTPTARRAPSSRRMPGRRHR